MQLGGSNTLPSDELRAEKWHFYKENVVEKWKINTKIKRRKIKKKFPSENKMINEIFLVN